VKPDLNSPQAIEQLVVNFYQRLLDDEQLAPIFIDVAGIDIREHFPRIRAYWEKLLLGSEVYRRHTMDVHRKLNTKRRFIPSDYERWLQHFVATVDTEFTGAYADRAKRVATRIAANMQASLANTPS
jgi:hemoglobin